MAWHVVCWHSIGFDAVGGCIPALVGAVRAFVESGVDPGRIGGLLPLTGTTPFFALKLANVRMLPFSTGRRSLVAGTIAILLIHASAIGSRLNPEPVPKELPLVPLMVHRTSGMGAPRF